MTDKLPPGWVATTLGAVVEPPRSKASPDSNPDLPFVGMDSIAADSMFLGRTTRFGEMKSNGGLFQEGDVLYGRMRPYLNKVHRAKFAGACSAEFIVFPESGAIKSDFLAFLLHHKRFVSFASSLSSGDRPRVNFGDVSKYEFGLPPTAEQDRIVSKIDELFSRIEEGERARERVQKLVERYRQSILKSAVTGELTREWREKNKGKLESGEAVLARIVKARREAWENAELAKMKAKGITPANAQWKQNYDEPSPPDTAELPDLPKDWVWSSLDQLSAFVTSGSRGWAKYYSATGSLFLRVGNMQRLAIRSSLENKQFVTPPPSAEGTRTRTRLGDLVISITADVGMSAVIDADVVGSYVNQHLSLVRPVSTALSSWIAWAVASPIVQLKIRDLKQGATKDGLTLDDVRAIPVPLCSEREIAEAISALEQLSMQGINAGEGAAFSARAAGGLRQSVLKSAFSGHLVRQDPADEPASALLERIAAELGTDNLASKRSRKKKTA